MISEALIDLVDVGEGLTCLFLYFFNSEFVRMTSVNRIG